MIRDKRTTRREFLQMGTAALAGAALPTSARGSSRSKDKQGQERKLVYRTLGRTGLKLPIISMGSCYAINLVRAALERGVVYIHTSAGYGNDEQLLGKAVRGVPRDSFVVATSPDLPYPSGNVQGRSLDLGKGADPARIVESLDESLRRLQLDHVDIYYLASLGSRDTVLHEPYLEAFDRLKRAGKTRFTGVATHANEPTVIRAAVDSGSWDVVLTAFNFRQTHREQVRSAIHAAAAAGLGIVAMKTQAGVYWDRAQGRKINMRAALKWVLQDEHVHTVIPAFANFAEMDEDLSVMEDLSMTAEERDDLGLGEDHGFLGYYCQQCGQCLPQCPAGLDIPTLLRSHMYAFGHRQPKKAKHVLRGWAPADVACADCSSCAVECAFGFDVRSRVMDIARILDVPGDFIG